jgi:hypothetical protein
VQSMRPVRVTFSGASPTLPLRMVSAGTGAQVGITLWVVADGRYEPQNFPWFRIDDSQIVWDWSASDSNYTTLRQQQESASGFTAWEVESSLDLDVGNTQSQIQNLAMYGSSFSGSSGGGGSSSGGTGAIGADGYDPIPASGSSPGETADQVMADDLGALFAGISSSTFRLTRLRTDLAKAALGNDLQLQASADQSPLTNLRTAAQSVNGPNCPIYDGCTIVGTAPYTPGKAGDGSSFGCSAAPVSGFGWGETAELGGLAGLLGLAVVRARRRRG